MVGSTDPPGLEGRDSRTARFANSSRANPRRIRWGGPALHGGAGPPRSRWRRCERESGVSDTGLDCMGRGIRVRIEEERSIGNAFHTSMLPARCCAGVTGMLTGYYQSHRPPPNRPTR